MKGEAMINGEKIRMLMRSKGITGRELALRVGVSEAMISYILQGLRAPNLQTLIRIATELDCKLDEIVVKAEK